MLICTKKMEPGSVTRGLHGFEREDAAYHSLYYNFDSFVIYAV